MLNKDSVLKTLRVGTVALALTTGGFAATNVVAQNSTPVSEQVEDKADDVKDEADGFDDWGLLGLLGLAGLAGLTRKAPQPVVHDDMDRTRTTGVGSTTGVGTTQVRDTNTTTVRDTDSRL